MGCYLYRNLYGCRVLEIRDSAGNEAKDLFKVKKVIGEALDIIFWTLVMVVVI